jgi:hypothetical protein
MILTLVEHVPRASQQASELSEFLIGHPCLDRRDDPVKISIATALSLNNEVLRWHTDILSHRGLVPDQGSLIRWIRSSSTSTSIARPLIICCTGIMVRLPKPSASHEA